MNLVTEIREYALGRYFGASWDIVAGWSDAQIADAIRGAKTRRGAIAKAWGVLQHIHAARVAGDYDVVSVYGPKPVRPLSVFEFLASAGGLRPDPELTVILDGNPFLGSRGPLLRSTGMSLDSARRLCVEGDYLNDTPWEGGLSVSTINDLLELISDEAHGMKRYPLSASGAFPVEHDPREEVSDDCPF